MENSNTGSVSEFLSVCVQLAVESNKIIHSIQKSDGKNTQMKGVDDPMTEADIKAQTLIIKGIRKFWPNICIVGEEDIEYQGDLGFDVEKLNLNMVDSQLFSNQNQFDISKVIVWVDPLDGTLSYVNNELDSVTTLIGVSYEGRPLMGIISQPYYQDENEQYQYNPTAYFGHVDTKKVFKLNQNDHFQQNGYSNSIQPVEHIIPPRQKKEDGSQLIVGCTSKNRMTEEKNAMVASLNADKIVRCGGAGKKVLDVIKGLCDFTVYIGKGTKKWDIAAPDALINCLQGQLSATDGSLYEYKQESEFHLNTKGMIASVDKQIYDRLINISKSFQN